MGGCNLRCRYCYNEDIVCDSGDSVSIPPDDFFQIIEKRKRLIDAVVITGGEPAFQTGVIPFVEKIKSIGFKIKLDTNGFYPGSVRELLDKSLIDYVAVDIKTSPSKYHELTVTQCNLDSLKETLALVKGKAPDYELRTTCVPDYFGISELEEIRDFAGKVKRYYLQQFRNENTLDKQLASTIPFSKEQLATFRDFVRTFAELCEIRGI
jgi:pyruvate formate lyase activating enzyme